MSDAEAPRVSVCVPTYNGCAYLAQTLRSISEQTFDDYEVVITDDQSTDQTLEIARGYAATDSRVRVIRNEERAGSSARNANRAASYARGEWIKFLFQDDFMAPTCLERMLEASRSGSLVIARTAFIYESGVDDETRGFYENHVVLRDSVFTATCFKADEFSRAVMRLWNTNFIGPTSSSLIHRNCFARYGPFDAEIITFPDLEYWIRVGTNEGLCMTEEQLVTFRVHASSISASIARDITKCFRYELEPLLLAMKLAWAPEYENLRNVAGSLSPQVNPEDLVTRKALSLRWKATEARYRARETTPFEEWSAFCRKQPRLHALMQSFDADRGWWARFKLFVKTRL